MSSINERCKHFLYNSNITKLRPDVRSHAGHALNKNDILSPCGNIAAYNFNDRFAVASFINKTSSKEIMINQSNIAYNIDKQYFQQGYNSSYTQWLDVTDEHFLVWMQMETFPNFKKKWGRVETDIPPGVHHLTIDVNWHYPDFQTEKYFIISSSQGIGTASFFGYTLLLSGVSLLIAMTFLCLTRNLPKNYFDPEEMEWK